MGPTTAAPTTTPSTTPATTTAAATTAAPTTAAASTTTPTTTVLPELVKKEIEQASEYMGTLNEAFDNGNLQQNMLDMDAFSGVTEVKLVAELNVQKADTDTPTQLLGTCQLSGLRLSDFQDAQRDAFKSAMAASSGAMKEHVSIRNVFAKSSRRRLRVTTSQASNGGDIVVDFAIMIVRDSSTEPPAAEEEESPNAGHVAAIAGFSILAVLLTLAIVFFLLRKYCAKKSQVGFVGKSKRKPTESSKRCAKYNSSIEMI